MAGKRHSPIGPMSKKSADVPHWTPPRQSFEQPQRVTNSLTTGSYSQAKDWANSALRPGALDFLKFSSRGTRC